MCESELPYGAIKDNVSLFFIAGHESTSAALCWILAILVTFPDVQEKVRREILEKLPEQPTPDQIKDLPYLEGLLRETLRLHPATPLTANRTTQKEQILNNLRIPPGVLIMTDLVTMSYDPNIWGDPLNVRPERWFQENMTKEQRSSWMPFTMGPRICIGMNFSLFEQKMFVVSLLKRFKSIKLAPHGEIKQKPIGVSNMPILDKFIFQFE